VEDGVITFERRSRDSSSWLIENATSATFVCVYAP
jgi:hypothetical protein